MNEDSGELEEGELFDESFDFKHITWKISNALSLPNLVDYKVKSPAFSFVGASWKLEMFPNGQTEKETEGYIDLYVRRLNSRILEHCVFFKFCFRTVKGKKFESYNSVFDSEMSGGGVMRYLKKSKFMDKKNLLAPNGVLTIMCQMRTKKIVAIDNFAQTESTPSLLGADWKLTMFPYGQTQFKSERYIDLNIVRITSRFPRHSVLITFCLKIVNEKEFESFSNNGTIDSEMSVLGIVCYLEKSKFMNKKNLLAPNGVLTIMCQMRMKKIAVIESFTQTESTPSLLDDSPEQTSKQEPESSASTSKGCNSTLKNPMALSGVKAFTEKMIQDFKELFQKQEDCDVIIKVKGKEFQAHRAILRARSPVFASTFRNDMKQKSTGILEIEDCDPSSFSDFLCFLYCGTVENLSTENVFSLFTSADKYDIQDLRSECLEFIKNNLSISTFCRTITLALQYSEEELVQLCTAFLAKNLKEVIMTVEWQSLLIENPIQCNEIMIKSLKSNEC